MNGTERIKAMLNNKPADRIGVSGWVHMPFVDRNVTDQTRATISITDYCGWDFVKIMTTGHYIPEAYGGDITYSTNPARWYGTIHRFPVTNLDELNNMPVLDMDNPVFRREVQVAKNLVDHYRGRLPVISTIFTPLTCLQEAMSRGTAEKTTELMLGHKAQTHRALQKLVETNFNYLDALMDAGIDGIFFASQYINKYVITPELYDEFCEPYDKMILDYVKDRTWFNIMHVHGEKGLMFDKCLDYQVQAFSWENCAVGVPDNEVFTVKQARDLTDKILITGLARHHDFHDPNNDRGVLKERFRRRLLTAMKECQDQRFVFAPGCALPMDVDRYVFTLMKEVVEEEGMA